MFKKDYALIYDELACLNNLKKQMEICFYCCNVYRQHNIVTLFGLMISHHGGLLIAITFVLFKLCTFF